MSKHQTRQSIVVFPRNLFLWGVLGGLMVIMAPGCTALHPVRGVPAAYLPDQYLGPSRDNKRTIDLSLLVRTPPDQYRVAAGDVLSIYVPRVLGSQPTEVTAVGIEPPINMPASENDPPTIGYPITVRGDNTIPLPQIGPLPVGGLTLHEVEQAIRKAYTVDHHILNPEEAMVIVSLLRPRTYRVLVVRQEANTTLTTSSSSMGTVNIGTTGRGSARTVNLKAYENDVLHALAQGDGVDGLPGLDAKNVIYVIRRRQPGLHGSGRNGACPPAVPGMHSNPAVHPTLPPVPLEDAQSRAHRPYGIQQVSFEELIAAQQGAATEQPAPQAAHVNPPPYSSYRGSLDAGHSRSSMPAGDGRGASYGHGLIPPEGPIAHSQYHPSTQYQQVSQHLPYDPPQYPQSGQYEPTPTPVIPEGSPATWPAITDGHSMRNYIPSPDPVESMYAQSWRDMLDNFDPTIDNPNIIRIPVRLAPGEQPNITEESITLYDGDIVFIDSRETEVFYTAGLLGGGQYMLPRDYDLGVLEAVSIAESSRTTGGGGGSYQSIGGVSALNHDVSNSASRLAILRTLPNGKRITIEVDLRKAMRYPEENIRVQPGDILFLQYTFPEAVCAFTQRYILEGALFTLAASQFQTR